MRDLESKDYGQRDPFQRNYRSSQFCKPGFGLAQARLQPLFGPPTRRKPRIALPIECGIFFLRRRA